MITGLLSSFITFICDEIFSDNGFSWQESRQTLDKTAKMVLNVFMTYFVLYVNGCVLLISSLVHIKY